MNIEINIMSARRGPATSSVATTEYTFQIWFGERTSDSAPVLFHCSSVFPGIDRSVADAYEQVEAFARSAANHMSFPA